MIFMHAVFDSSIQERKEKSEKEREMCDIGKETNHIIVCLLFMNFLNQCKRTVHDGHSSYNPLVRVQYVEKFKKHVERRWNRSGFVSSLYLNHYLNLTINLTMDIPLINRSLYIFLIKVQGGTPILRK